MPYGAVLLRAAERAGSCATSPRAICAASPAHRTHIRIYAHTHIRTYAHGAPPPSHAPAHAPLPADATRCRAALPKAKQALQPPPISGSPRKISAPQAMHAVHWPPPIAGERGAGEARAAHESRREAATRRPRPRAPPRRIWHMQPGAASLPRRARRAAGSAHPRAGPRRASSPSLLPPARAGLRAGER
ncbi:hypothetical protein HYPSUDRAFT_199404 [Hypholoma sublateritium FD-334 SS-4]|uniref:Uncharacterized protein n=1 Tax=Hypholoma sublateritium (strain FD-334 SS-4) TaxID=945553 RepID=A0A0D2PAS8_HYPSF|nr:hypothetical protein HYPSUDRAFT_199404 [Hypholoma sublateritium FD-334 SS-4]